MAALHKVLASPEEAPVKASGAAASPDFDSSYRLAAARLPEGIANEVHGSEARLVTGVGQAAVGDPDHEAAVDHEAVVDHEVAAAVGHGEEPVFDLEDTFDHREMLVLEEASGPEETCVPEVAFALAGTSVLEVESVPVEASDHKVTSVLEEEFALGVTLAHMKTCEYTPTTRQSSPSAASTELEGTVEHLMR